jgi:hypothetical protein
MKQAALGARIRNLSGPRFQASKPEAFESCAMNSLTMELGCHQTDAAEQASRCAASERRVRSDSVPQRDPLRVCSCSASGNPRVRGTSHSCQTGPLVDVRSMTAFAQADQSLAHIGTRLPGNFRGSPNWAIFHFKLGTNIPAYLPDVFVKAPLREKVTMQNARKREWSRLMLWIDRPGSASGAKGCPSHRL